MFTGASDGHAVQHFKKVKVKRLQQRGRSSFVLFLLVPLVELLLGASENFIYRAFYAEFFIDKAPDSPYNIHLLRVGAFLHVKTM